jgi:hypothetical protein
MDIDRQRIAAVRVIEALMRRADTLVSCAEGTDEEAELKAIGDLLRPTKARGGRSVRSREGRGSSPAR